METQYLLSNEVQIAYSETEGYVPVTSMAQNSPEYQDYLSRAGEDNQEHYAVKIAELGGNAAPVIQVLRVTEEYAVDHKYRVFCLADLQGLTLFVAPVSLALFADFASCDLNYYREHEKISNGDHAAEDAKKPHSDAYLL